MVNPFRPTLGATPPRAVGREAFVTHFGLALDDGPGAHERITLITGPRGIGKTVLLNEFEDIARQRSWWVISETATEDFTTRIRDQAQRLIVDQLRPERKRAVGVQIARVGGASWESAEELTAQGTLRSVLTELLDLQAERDRRLDQQPVGVLITLDELHYSRRSDVIEFATVIQHLVRENREIAVAMAGIPGAVVPLLADSDGNSPVTFLRRANRIDLEMVSVAQAREALVAPLLDGVGSWSADALDVAVKSTGGYPFMIQLVGQNCLRLSRDGQISATEAAAGVDIARFKLKQLVLEPALADLSDGDRAFLHAMAQDDGPSRMGDLADRLGVNAQHAGVYRKRLIEAQMIRSQGRGQVEFELPGMREYLRELAAEETF